MSIMNVLVKIRNTLLQLQDSYLSNAFDDVTASNDDMEFDEEV